MLKEADLDWQGGQPRSRTFDDCYFSSAGGIEESEYVFFKQNNLPQQWQGKKQFTIAETGFGTGLNFLVTAKNFLSSNSKNSTLYYYSIEKFPLTKGDIQQALACWPTLSSISQELINHYPPATPGFHILSLFNNRIVLVLLYGDVELMLSEISCSVDAWYLDGFSPEKNPAMWQQSVLTKIAALSHVGTRLATYTVAGEVRRGLLAVGFNVEKVKGFGKKRHMLTAVMVNQCTKDVVPPWYKSSPIAKAENRVAIIGAGIAGLTTAWELVLRGYKVDLIDKHSSIAQQSSGSPAAIVMPRVGASESVDNAFYAMAFEMAVDKLNQIAERVNEFSWQQCGVMQLASNERLQRIVSRCQPLEGYLQSLNGQQASQIAGVDLAVDAVLLPTAGWLDAGLLCNALLSLCGDHVKFVANTRIENIEPHGEGWRLYAAQQQCVLETNTVILCAAADCLEFEQTSSLPLQQVRGQISYLPANAVSSQLKCVVCYDGYIIPAHDGQHTVGATFSPENTSTAVTYQDHVDNVTSLATQLPVFTQLALDTLPGRASVRAVTADRLPIVGGVADQVFFKSTYHDLRKGKKAETYPPARYLSGLYINTGHGSRGFTSAFLSAQWLAGQINNEPSILSQSIQQALHPARFIIRQLKKQQS